MPWTIAHAAAILPIAALSPRAAYFIALAIGSMTPDFGYYIRMMGPARFAHTFEGSVLFCLPAGLLVLGVLTALRKPLWFMLPQPHRAALGEIAHAPLDLRARTIAAVCACVLIGSWTHIVWDAFTHRGTWMVAQLPLLRAPVSLGDSTYPLYLVLQHASTLVGTVALAVAYWMWLRRRSALSTGAVSAASERWRWGAFVATATVALVIGTAYAYRSTLYRYGLDAMNPMLFYTVVASTCAFIALFFTLAVACYTLRRAPLAAQAGET